MENLKIVERRRWLSKKLSVVIFMLYKILTLLICLAFISCKGGYLADGKGFVSYEVSFNADKSYIINEATFILQLYEYTLEIVDPTKDYYVVQTYWRIRDGQIPFGSDTVTALFRDRVLIHIVPRGRSSFYFRTYQVYNTVLQFEFQVKMGANNWVKFSPPRDYLMEYSEIVKELKMRMLRYGPSPGG